ncbi:hypothetical protein BA059_03235 [Mycolicibacterium sp. (ex Dasyatis americana)]|uniref:DUF6199 family natural product biosynthesis protein n=1 Tax=Mycobacterium sp. DBP42 TaxID=2545267 RepID=UPI0008728EDE|nr:DUF6199 family natural product biosynthesis protein [Mycobacterium sp. DBP42]OFB43743.1 hypothetical protein BA059_03235 [Mycolicibacterium sp. (ex Dasyatis americana)]TMS54231.1 hypothetical protein E0T84_08340 [Mycobacterium sp. DBP42]
MASRTDATGSNKEFAMLGLGILCFLLAAALVFFATRPKLAFYLDEGWKFRGETEPSDTYVAVNGVGRIIGAVVAVVVGIACIGQYFGEKSDEGAKQQQSDLYAAARQRCETQVRPRFNQTIKWDNGMIANHQEVQALADGLEVEIEFVKDAVRRSGGQPNTPTENMWVRDRTLPKHHDMLLYYHGGLQSLGKSQQPTECSMARPPL